MLRNVVKFDKRKALSICYLKVKVSIVTGSAVLLAAIFSRENLTSDIANDDR